MRVPASVFMQRLPSGKAVNRSDNLGKCDWADFDNVANSGAVGANFAFCATVASFSFVEAALDRCFSAPAGNGVSEAVSPAGVTGLSPSVVAVSDNTSAVFGSAANWEVGDTDD